jgi:HAE1 family hydrophobic/amphiphilic exporter-1
MGNDIYDVLIRYGEQDRNSPDDIRKILIKTDNGNVLPIETITGIVEKITVKAYKHYNNSRSVGITSDLAPGHNLTEAVEAIEKIAAELVNNDNTKIEYLGEIKNMKESDSGSLVTFLFALVFIFLVLSAQFESFADASLILVAVPFSMTGGVLTLLLFGNTINMYSNIGLVTLIGLVTKNAIMLVEFANQLREEHGMKIKEAVMESAKLRLRPILMTSIATICGAVPLVLAHGAGAASRNSVGLVIVGGMIIGTIFTIFVIPVLYQTFKRERRVIVDNGA